MMKEQEPRVIFAEAMDEDDLADSEEEAMIADDDIAEDIPVMKRRKLDPEM
jgi:hypothetical protein